MVGICGTIGGPGDGHHQLTDRLKWTGRERTSTYRDDALSLSLLTHEEHSQPATASCGDAHVWLWGSVWGVHEENGYRPREKPTTDPAAYCARLYDEHGIEFVDRLNGGFAGVVRDQERGVVHLFTDRLGTRPIYRAYADGTYVFATSVQAVPRHPEVEAEVDRGLLAEYLTTGRVIGTETPLQGVRELPPSTVVTVDPDTGETTRRRYWVPRRDPLNCSFSTFVDRFTDQLEDVLAERFGDDRRYGLLLSGGSDSRLLLGMTDQWDVAFHSSDWMSEEARTAERAALTADTPFQWLHRDGDHHRRVLDAAPSAMNFYGRFEQAQVADFVDDIASEVDVLVSALYADVLFKGHTLPTRSVNLGPVGTLELPFERSIDSVEEFLSRVPDSPGFVPADESPRDRVAERTDAPADGPITCGDVVYPTIRELVSLVDLYPLSNDPDLFYWNLVQSIPHWTPFLDNRLVELSLRMPISYQLRRDTPNAALAQVAPDLAEIEHAASGVAPSRSFALHYLGRNVTALRRRLARSTPKPYYTHHPWRDNASLLVHDIFAGETLRDRRPEIEDAPFLDWDAILTDYERHIRGIEKNTIPLYLLLSLLEMPVFDELLDEQAGDAPSTTEPISATDPMVIAGNGELTQHRVREFVGGSDGD